MNDYAGETGWDLIEKSYRDPDRYFPKKQAHPVRKTLPRMIASASIVDQLVTRCFFQGFTEKEGQVYPLLCTKKGIGFDAEHAALLGPQFDAMCAKYGPPLISDVVGWEKNFTSVLADATATVMINTSTNPLSQNLHRACSWWATTLLTNPGYLDDGAIISFGDAMVQRSGNYLTTTSNGIGRATLAYYVGSVPFCCGDDCNEWSFKTPLQIHQEYERLGLPLRDVKVGTIGRYEFCSHVFTKDVNGKWVSWLFSWQRMIWEAANNKTYDYGSDMNWLKEVENMDDVVTCSLIKKFIAERALLITHGEHD